MAYRRDSMPLFGTGSRGFGTTWGNWPSPHVPSPSAETTERESYARRADYAGRGPKSYRRSDERILEEVCMRLTDDPDIDPSDVEVHVSGGEVTLQGTVDSRRTRRLVEEVTESVAGVREIRNELRISAPAMDRS